MKKLMLCLMLVGFTASTQAMIYLNPGISIGVSGGTESNDLDNNPFLGGVQFGWGSMGLTLGVDYELSLTDLEFDTTPTSEYSESALGVFVGYQFPVMFRLYGAYMLSGKMKCENCTQNIEADDLGGYKLGLAYTGFPMVNINLEIRKYEYDKITVGNNVTTGADAELDLITIGASIPLSF